MADMYEANIDAMNQLQGFDVIIVCTGNQWQAGFWQERLEAARGQVLGQDTIVLAVDEDWEGGAGNALGTFYAYQKACRLAATKGGAYIPAGSAVNGSSVDLLSANVSVAMYHTAGKGTRLAPLPGAENNNKPGVKLPALVGTRAITILEAVIKQTGVYAASRKGRLSVFWGDQVFIPSVTTTYTPQHHADILSFLGPMLTEQEWEERGMQKYGLIAVNKGNQAAQVEKVTYQTATRLLESLGELAFVGPSLGSFSVSKDLLGLFLDGFAAELASKTGKFDADPHLWMPLTLEHDSYVELMAQKSVPADQSSAHHVRMRAMITGLDQSALGLFGAVDVGKDAFWWDYGQLRLYQKNALRMRDGDAEAALMRKFYGVARGEAGLVQLDTPAAPAEAKQAPVEVDATSCLSACSVRSGSVKQSVLCDVAADSIEADGAIIVNCTAGGRIVAPPGSVLYNVCVPGDIIMEPGVVRVGVFGGDGEQKLMQSRSDIDGGKAWKDTVCDNDRSFEQVYLQNLTADVSAMDGFARQSHALVRRNSKFVVPGEEKEAEPASGDASQSRLVVFAGIAAAVAVAAAVVVVRRNR